MKKYVDANFVPVRIFLNMNFLKIKTFHKTEIPYPTL